MIHFASPLYAAADFAAHAKSRTEQPQKSHSFENCGFF